MADAPPFTTKIAGLLALSLLCSMAPVDAIAKTHPAKPAPLTKRERAEHLLDRLTFGPRPGDVEQVEALGVKQWIDQQLYPETINNAALEARLVQFPAMQLSTEALMQQYPPNPVIRQLDAGHGSMPNDPVERAIYSSALADFRQRREIKAAQDLKDQKTASAQAAAPIQNVGFDQTAKVATLLREPVAVRWSDLLTMQPGAARPLLQKMSPVQRQQLAEGMTPRQKEVLLALVQTNRVVAGELLEEKLLREIYSSRQLEEVMTDFWFNHFSIYLRKNEEEPWYLAAYERDVIRPHALGKFEDLLDAVAHSPAMLVYLDNQQSIGPHSLAAMRAAANPNQKNNTPGLNENYARELMELHTLGVNGGYSQNDVVELAKVLTGWGVKDNAFEFNERRHEPGMKTVLGQRINENGEAEGMQVLHILAESPATARFLSTKLAMRFVSDDPPKPLIDRMTKTYLKTHGDIREVLRTMLKSPEFWSRDVYRAKLKTPQEFVVSSLRATDAAVENATALAASLDRLGMPLYGVQQPNGYSLKADPWLGAEALLARMNFALALTTNRIPGVKVSVAENTALDPEQKEAHLEETLLDGRVTPHTHDAVLGQMESNPTAQVAVAAFTRNQTGKRGDLFAPVAQRGDAGNQSTLAAALLLGSPDFQRR
jgi:uncharacterized protein (DUF1800 family)